MRYSKQRETILNVVNHSSDHPTAEMVYHKVKKLIPNISLGTVYRNLNALVEASQIKRISIPKDVDHFDYRHDEHYHFCCTECHHLYDLPGITIHQLVQELEQDEMVKIMDYEVLFYGICSQCLKGKEDSYGIKRK